MQEKTVTSTTVKPTQNTVRIDVTLPVTTQHPHLFLSKKPEEAAPAKQEVEELDFVFDVEVDDDAANAKAFAKKAAQASIE